MHTELEREGELRTPHPMETLSSYLAAWRGHTGVSRRKFLERVSRLDPTVDAALNVDPDFPPHPNWPPVVAEVTSIDAAVLRKLGTPVGPWHLAPPCRTHACIACLADSGGPSNQARHKLWAYAPVTTCYTHGTPLVEVPAVGWEWMELSAADRKKNVRLMLRPDEICSTVDAFWNRLDDSLRDAIWVAEMSAWVAPNPLCELGKLLKYHHCDEQPVWEDLLALLCSPWSRFPGAPLSLRGLPRDLWVAANKRYFGNYDHPGLDAPPSIGYFCTMTSAGQRRACVLTASLVIRRQAMESKLGRHFCDRWKDVLRHMPDDAFDWLCEQATRWPLRWQEALSNWRRERRRVRRGY